MKIPPIPTSIKKAMCSQRAASIAENTVYAVAIETALKMAGRPTFIYFDKKADPESKKYASVKEFLYQGTCLGLYLLIVPSVKEGINKIIKNRLSKTVENKAGVDLFKGTHLGKGAKELSAIIGTVVTLAIIAPQLSHFIVHPMMKVLGFKDDKKPEGVKPQVAPQINIKA